MADNSNYRVAEAVFRADHHFLTALNAMQEAVQLYDADVGNPLPAADSYRNVDTLPQALWDLHRSCRGWYNLCADSGADAAYGGYYATLVQRYPHALSEDYRTLFTEQSLEFIAHRD